MRTHPDRTVGVVYMSGQGLLDSWDAGNRAIARQEQERRRTAGEHDRVQSLAGLSTRTRAEERAYRLLSWRPDFSPGAPAEERLAADVDAPWNINLAVNRELMADARTQALRLRESLASLDVPVLVVHGVNDPRPIAAAEELRRLVPDGELAALETGHSPWLEDPAATSGAVRVWLHRLRP